MQLLDSIRKQYPALDNEFGVVNENFEYGDIRRYGGVGDGVTDDSNAIINAFKSQKTHPEFILKFEKNKTYICRKSPTIAPYSYLEGNGATIKVDRIEGYLANQIQFFWDNGYQGHIEIVNWENLNIVVSPELFQREETGKSAMIWIFKIHDCEEFHMKNVNVVYNGDERNIVNLFTFEGHGKIFMENCYFKNTMRVKENGSIIWIQSKLADGYYARIKNCHFYTNTWDEAVSCFCSGTHDVVIDGCTIEKYWYDTYYNDYQELKQTFCGYFVTNNYLSPTTFTDEEISQIYQNVVYQNCKLICKPINEESTIGILGLTVFGNVYATPSMLKFVNCDIEIVSLCQLVMGDTKSNYTNNIDWCNNSNVVFDNCTMKLSKFKHNRGILRSNAANITIQNSKLDLERYLYNQLWIEANVCTCHKLVMDNNTVYVTNTNGVLFAVHPLAKEQYIITNNEFIVTDDTGVMVDIPLLKEETANCGYETDAAVFYHEENAAYRFYSTNNRINGKVVSGEYKNNNLLLYKSYCTLCSDGTTLDWSPAFKKALENGSVFVPEGQYFITTDINLTAEGIGIYGVGVKSEIRAFKDSSFTNAMIYIQNSFVEIKNIRVCGRSDESRCNSAIIKTTYKVGTTDTKTNFIKLINVTCNYSQSFGINLNNAYDVVVDNCNVTFCMYGYNISSTDTQISNSYASFCDKEGFRLFGGLNQLTNCKSYFNGTVGFYGNATDYSFVNCDAQENGTHGFNFYSGNSIVLSNCHSESNGVSDNTSSAFYITSCTYVQLNGCKAMNCGAMKGIQSIGYKIESCKEVTINSFVISRDANYNICDSTFTDLYKITTSCVNVFGMINDTILQSSDELYDTKITSYLNNNQILSRLTHWYNAVEYGLSPSNTSYNNGIALYKLIASVEANGGGTIYIPSGKYNIQNPNNYIIRTSNIRIIGDGASTNLIRWSNNPLFRYVGVSKNIEIGKQLTGIQLSDMYILSSQSYSESLTPILEFEACTGIRINNLNLRGAGTHICFIECFDSKVISTDFELSGRSYKATTDIADDFVDYQNSVNDSYTPTIIFKSNITSHNQSGYESNGTLIETTNQILFTNCRFESFYGGAVGLEGNGTNGIVFESCKFESMQSRVPFFVFRNYVTNFSWNNCFICKFTKTKSGGVDLSKVPIMYSDNLFLSNNIDATVSIQTYDKTTMSVDLFKLYQNSTKPFGSNTINIRCKSSNTDGSLVISNGSYIVNALIPHELYLNGNKTNVYNYCSYGGVNTEYEPVAPITTAPTDKWHKKGERILFTEADANGKTEAICTVSGTPGTWILK